jgi:hypothetical protein
MLLSRRFVQFLVLAYALVQPALGTPLIALKEANNCAACHPDGRAQKPVFERRCTLDCQGCHIDPNGGGGRNEWGKYYSQTPGQLNMWSMMKAADPAISKKLVSVHTDFRRLIRGHDSKWTTFPMGLDTSVQVRPVEKVRLLAGAVLLGKTNDNLMRIINDERRFQQRYSVMIDDLPLNSWVRYSKDYPVYGIRRPNHSTWIRERIGLDQFAQTEAFTFGLTPNVPFARFSYMTGDPAKAESERQKGTSWHAGFRGVSYAWHLNASGWNTASELATIDMKAIGAGANVFKFITYAEMNTRSVTSNAASAIEATRVHPSSEISEWTIAYAGLPMTILGVVAESMDTDASSSSRMNYFVEMHPYQMVQLEIWHRVESGARSLTDDLISLKIYFDF